MPNRSLVVREVIIRAEPVAKIPGLKKKKTEKKECCYDCAV